VLVRILVTGGAGFIGSWVTHQLALWGHEVAVLDDLSGGYRQNLSPDVPFWKADLTNEEEVSAAVSHHRPEVIVHAAAYAAEGLSHWMRRYCYTQNLIGWANLANAAVRHDVRRIVACSSMAVYGPQEPPFTEQMVPQPADPYGAAKAAMEVDLRALSEVHGIEWMVVRPHNVYGPRQNLADPYRNVVAIFMRQALAGDPLTVFGDGGQVRAFSFVDDVARVIARCATDDACEVLNVGGEEPITIRELADRVLAATGSSSEVVHLPPRHEVRDAFCEHRALRRLYGRWEPTPMEVGLGQMAEWAKGLTIGPLRSYDYEVRDRLYEAWK
jgi:UDP-glucose 4-epimerase